jgi:hypothetical protein
MPIDFGRIATPKQAPRPTDPIAIFQSLRVDDPAVNDLWLAQGDALREWDSVRSKSDLAIVLNTGAGKTLVGPGTPLAAFRASQKGFLLGRRRSGMLIPPELSPRGHLCARLRDAGTHRNRMSTEKNVCALSVHMSGSSRHAGGIS